MAKKKKNKDVEYPSIEILIDALTAEHGDGAISQGISRKRVKCEAISTGALNLDMAIGIGGIPRGRITEIYGPYASGKTTLTLEIAANAQRDGGVVAFVDAEHAIDPIYAGAIGVDMSKILFSQPDSAEQALDIVETLCRSGMCSLVIVDSVAALVPQAELDGNMGDSHVGLQARLIGQACRKLAGIVQKTNTSLIFINQIREKIGVMFGSPETTSGGRALPYYASVRLDIRRIGKLGTKEDPYGNATRVKVVKNKVGSPFRQAEFDILFGKGINNVGCLLDVSVEQKVVEKRGSNYYYNNNKIGVGRPNACEFLESNLDVVNEIREKVLATDTLEDVGFVEEKEPEKVFVDEE